MMKKDFEGIARALRSAQAEAAMFPTVDREIIARLYAERVADYCEGTNRMFNREKFLTTCILVEEEFDGLPRG